MSSIPLSDAKAHLARLLHDVSELGERVTITRSGRPAAVLLSVEEYEGLVETLEILADRNLARAVARGQDEAARGEVVSHAELWRELDG